MRLSDVLGHLDLDVFPIVGLICFGSVFIAVVWRVFRSDKACMRRAAAMALGDDRDTTAGKDA